jgi:hypothetical protein
MEAADAGAMETADAGAVKPSPVEATSSTPTSQRFIRNQGCAHKGEPSQSHKSMPQHGVLLS